MPHTIRVKSETLQKFHDQLCFTQVSLKPLQTLANLGVELSITANLLICAVNVIAK